MDVTPELLSRYADGEVSPEEAEAVEGAVRAESALSAELEDFRLLSELFGHVEPEEVSDALTRRLQALDAVAPVEGFRLVEAAAAPRRGSWAARVAAIAAVALLAIGIVKLTERTEVVLRDVARVSVAPDGTVADIRRLAEVKIRSGETLRAGESERLSFRTVAGDRVTLLPGGALAVGDPLDGQIFELERGTVLCSVRARYEPQEVRAGPYRIVVAREAHFGVRMAGANVRPAGAAVDAVEVTVTVSLGSVDVFRNGDHDTVAAYERATFSPRGEERTHAATDPVFFDLMRSYREHSREILPGFFVGEPGVEPITQRWTGLGDGGKVLVLSDEGAAAIRSTHLVLRVRASEPGPLRLTRVRPLADRPGEAEAVTVPTPPVGRDWTVIAVPRAAFEDAAAEKTVRRIDAASRLVRLELAPVAAGTRIEVQTSLWAARPPLEIPEVVR